ncbi:MAG: hypothetical protein QW497_05155 [Candidatus Bathyarchaeia archaeon]
MRKAMMKSTVLSVTILMLFMAVFPLNIVKSQSIYSVEWVNHRISILHNGFILVNDTVKLVSQSLDHFLIGFPSKYAQYLVDYAAFDTASGVRFSITPGVQVEGGRRDIYFLKVNLDGKASQVLTIIFTLSNSLLTLDKENLTLYRLDFPAYPSLVVNAALCNVSISLPYNAKYVNGTVESLSYSKANLEAFTYAPANITFLYDGDEIQLLKMELVREVNVDGAGTIQVSETYRIKNLSPKRIIAVILAVPRNAFNVIARDEFGRKISITELPGKPNTYRVSIPFPVEGGGSTVLVIAYNLPKDECLKGDESNLKITLPNFEYMTVCLDSFQLKLTLPEGAKILAIRPGEVAYNLERSTFQDRVALKVIGLSPLSDINFEVEYVYNILWLTFRPTLWVWTATMLGCAIVAVATRKPKVSARVAVLTTIAPLAKETLQKFLDSYEEKRRLVSDIVSLEEAARKGRIPRRKYKVQLKTLEVRLNSISASLEELKRKIQAAGGLYADLMRQLNEEEAKLEEIKAEVQKAEARYKRGELSTEAYRRLMEDYARKREDAEAEISGILMKLREEL